MPSAGTTGHSADGQRHPRESPPTDCPATVLIALLPEYNARSLNPSFRSGETAGSAVKPFVRIHATTESGSQGTEVPDSTAQGSKK
jgi:hypothetical protein